MLFYNVMRQSQHFTKELSRPLLPKSRIDEGYVVGLSTLLG
jgi:hypothetical protein